MTTNKMKSFCDKWESQIKALQILEAESIRDPSQRDKIHREMAISIFNDMWNNVKNGGKNEIN